MSENNRLIRLLSSAGGGKTYRLSTRYKELLKGDNQNLKKTLAITFTNKAATEMKERILGLLKEEVLKEGNKHSRELIDFILDNYSDFSVRTIDSFVNSLVKAFSIELGIAPEAEIIIDSNYYKDFATSLVIRSVEQDKNLRRKLSDFIINRIETGDKISWDFHGLLRKGMDKIEKYEGNGNISFEKPPEDLAKLDKDISICFNKSISLAEEILEYSEHYSGIDIRFLRTLEKGAGNRDINKILESSFIKKEPEEALTNSFKDDPEDFARLFKELKKYVFNYYKQRLLREHNYQIDIYEIYREILKIIKEKQRVRFIEDINKELKVLFDEFSIPFVFYRIGEKFIHYLVDEFQDTSRDQWQNLVPLIDNALSEGGSFFYVGDPKQAIYQWRGGDVELFDTPSNLFASVGEAEKKSNYIDKNYRSARAIVDFVGEVFSELPEEIKCKMGQKSNFYTDTVKQRIPDFKAGEDFEGLVSIKKIKPKSKNIEDIFSSINTQLEETIKEILDRGYSHGDIAILVRRNNDAKEITEHLCGKGYPVVSSETLYLSGNPVIKGLLSALGFLKHPTDNASFLGLLTSPFFCRKTGLDENVIINFAEDCSSEISYYIQFEEKFPGLWQSYIEPFFSCVGFLPVYDLVSDLIRTFKIPENCEGCESFLEAFLEFIHTLEEQSITSIEGMLGEWQKKCTYENPPSILLPESTEAIKIMTIHSAKGLEFPVVIIPFIYIPFDQDKNEVVVEYKGIKRIIKVKKDILPLNDAPLREEIESKLIEKEQNETFEEINNFYVALTRAKYELRIFTCDEKPQSYSDLWKKVLEPFSSEDAVTRGKKVQKPTREEGKDEIPLKYLKMDMEGKESVEKASSRLLFRKNDMYVLMNEKISSSQKTGDILHKILYYIEDVNSLGKLDSIINQSINEFAYPGERKVLKEKTKPVIEEVFKKEEIKEWFSPGVEVWREQEIVSGDGNLYRLDRVVFGADAVHIIDFKSGEEPLSKWKKQLKKYKEVMSSYFPDKTIKTYIVDLNSAEVIEIE
ncbi:UvrD-helicase domain-containing protein [candidate division WOR-3 bacterium]|nr:UvrD-helicase domain-containing protein [candidate division WOR-3 bacterium]